MAFWVKPGHQRKVVGKRHAWEAGKHVLRRYSFGDERVESRGKTTGEEVSPKAIEGYEDCSWKEIRGAVRQGILMALSGGAKFARRLICAQI